MRGNWFVLRGKGIVKYSKKECFDVELGGVGQGRGIADSVKALIAK